VPDQFEIPRPVLEDPLDQLDELLRVDRFRHELERPGTMQSTEVLLRSEAADDYGIGPGVMVRDMADQLDAILGKHTEVGYNEAEVGFVEQRARFLVAHRSSALVTRFTQYPHKQHPLDEIVVDH
jgi:hypothetical protein